MYVKKVRTANYIGDSYFFHKIKQIRAAFKSIKAVFEPLFLLYGVVTHTYQPCSMVIGHGNNPFSFGLLIINNRFSG